MSDQNSEPRQAPAPTEPTPARPTAADMIKDYRESDPLRAIRH